MRVQPLEVFQPILIQDDRVALLRQRGIRPAQAGGWQHKTFSAASARNQSRPVP
jgi:hypothetical protein